MSNSIKTGNSAGEAETWTGRPSQSVSSGLYALCAIAGVPLVGFALISALSIYKTADEVTGIMFVTVTVGPLAALIVFWHWRKVRCCSYSLTNHRYKFSFGVFSRKFQEIEQYRVGDVVVDQPFLLRLVGLCNITTVGFDVDGPRANIRAVRHGAALREKLRTLVEKRRDDKSVRVAETTVGVH